MKKKKRNGRDEWNRKQTNCTKMVGENPRPQFSVDERVFMVLKLAYTETGNGLETIWFQRQFPNRNFHYCWCACSNINHTGHTYCNCPLLFVCTESSDAETAFETFLNDCFHNITSFCVLLNHKHPFIFLKMWSGIRTNYLRTILLLHSSRPLSCSTSWFHLS